MRVAMAGRGAPTGGVKLYPMMALAVRVLGLSLALCVAVSSGASGPSVNHVPTHGPDYRLGLSDIMNQYQQFGSAPANYFINPLDFDAKEGRVVVGAADKLYLLNKDTLVMEGEVTITADSSAVTSCQESYEDFVCQNHIRIYTKSVASDIIGTKTTIAPYMELTQRHILVEVTLLWRLDFDKWNQLCVDS